MSGQTDWKQRVYHVDAIGERIYEVSLIDDQGVMEKVLCRLFHHNQICLVEVDPDIIMGKEPARIFGRDLAAAVIASHRLQTERDAHIPPGPTTQEGRRNAKKAPWGSGYFGTGADATAVAEQGRMGAVLQAPSVAAQMVVIEPLGHGKFLVRDPAIGGTYEVTPEWIEKYVSGGIWRSEKD